MKALEDISIKYDSTVRMSNEHIVQFTYGDDGLDPMFMDDNRQPVSLNRLFTIIRERTKATVKVMSEPLMLPSEIDEETEKSIRDCKIFNVSKKFMDHFREFTKKNLSNEVRHVR